MKQRNHRKEREEKYRIPPGPEPQNGTGQDKYEILGNLRGKNGRGDTIRTCDPLLPKQVL